MTQFEKLKQLILDTQGDVDKASRGNDAAITRVRAAYQKAKSICQDGREEVLELRKARAAAK
jgi:uncharacterized protein GlcG (DUF336 family)